MLTSLTSSPYLIDWLREINLGLAARMVIRSISATESYHLALSGRNIGLNLDLLRRSSYLDWLGEINLGFAARIN